MKGKTEKAGGRFPYGITVRFPVTLPEHFYREAQRIVSDEGYADLSDYLRDLIRMDFRERGVTVKIEKELEEI